MEIYPHKPIFHSLPGSALKVRRCIVQYEPNFSPPLLPSSNQGIHFLDRFVPPPRSVSTHNVGRSGSQGFLNQSFLKYLFFNQNATFTNPIITGTSTRGPITAANASPDAIPNTDTAPAIARSNLLLAAGKD